MKKSLILICVLAVLSGCKKQQKVIYQVESIKYKKFEEIYVEEECVKLSQDLSKYLNNGWRVVSSSPKEKIVTVNYFSTGTCIGTEYIIEK